jgi:hypothetical protein
MTPKEKAKELLDKMSIQTYRYQPYAGANYSIDEIGYEAGKKCALICVDEIFSNNTNESKNDYWIEVKQEIEQL